MLEFRIERIDIAMQGANIVARSVERTIQRFDLGILAMHRVANLGADCRTDDGADGAASDGTDHDAATDADIFLFRGLGSRSGRVGSDGDRDDDCYEFAHVFSPRKCRGHGPLLH